MLKKLLMGLTTTVALATTSPAYAGNFETFLESVLTPSEVEIYQKMGNEAAIQLARQACTSMDSGMSVRDFVTRISQSLARQGLPQEQLQTRAMYAGKVIAAGVASFCPQHMSDLLQLQQE